MININEEENDTNNWQNDWIEFFIYRHVSFLIRIPRYMNTPFQYGRNQLKYFILPSALLFIFIQNCFHRYWLLEFSNSIYVLLYILRWIILKNLRCFLFAWSEKSFSFNFLKKNKLIYFIFITNYQYTESKQKTLILGFMVSTDIALTWYVLVAISRTDIAPAVFITFTSICLGEDIVTILLKIVG